MNKINRRTMLRRAVVTAATLLAMTALAGPIRADHVERGLGIVVGAIVEEPSVPGSERGTDSGLRSAWAVRSERCTEARSRRTSAIQGTGHKTRAPDKRGLWRACGTIASQSRSIRNREQWIGARRTLRRYRPRCHRGAQIKHSIQAGSHHRLQGSRRGMGSGIWLSRHLRRVENSSISHPTETEEAK